MSDNQEVAVQEQSQEQQSVLSGDPVTNTPETNNVDWRQGLPEDIRGDKSLESFKDVSSLAKSYIHAQKMVGSEKISVPNKYATEDDWNAVYEKLGRPKTADEYKFDVKDVDAEGLKTFANQAHKMGLLPHQANEMVKWYQQNVEQTNLANDAKAEEARKNSVMNLKKEYGQAYDNKLKAASEFAKQYIDPKVLNANMEDGTKLGDHPEIIKAFVNIAGKMGEDQFVNPSGPTYLTPKEINKQIATLTAPGSAYWDKNHPSHADAVQEVLALREQKVPV
jgi:hypothetical protein